MPRVITLVCTVCSIIVKFMCDFILVTQELQRNCAYLFYIPGAISSVVLLLTFKYNLAEKYSVISCTSFLDILPLKAPAC